MKLIRYAFYVVEWNDGKREVAKYYEYNDGSHPSWEVCGDDESYPASQVTPIRRIKLK